MRRLDAKSKPVRVAVSVLAGDSGFHSKEPVVLGFARRRECRRLRPPLTRPPGDSVRQVSLNCFSTVVWEAAISGDGEQQIKDGASSSTARIMSLNTSSGAW